MDPVCFQLGPLTIHWYGIFLATGFLVGLWTAGRRGLRAGLEPERVWDAAVWLVVGSFIGARILFVVSYWEENFAGKPWTEIFMVHQGGLVFYGGLIGACLAFIMYTQWKKLSLWRMADVMAPSISLGYAIGRNGCLMTGCCFGRECGLPWAIHFPDGHEMAGVGVHPTQIYESLLGFGLYAALAWLYRRRAFDGQVFAAYLFGYAVLRSIVESFRGDYGPHYIAGWITQAHVVSLLILATGIVLFIALQRKAQPR